MGDNPSSQQLRRQLGLLGAVMVGLGSIVGTGVFVSVGLAASLAGSGVLLAIGLAGIVATCNGLNSAQLAASHPVSGGTYEYGYKYLTPWLGFLAGWMFLCAKSASAATAALGLSAYLAAALQIELSGSMAMVVALAAVGTLTILALCGARLSSRVNIVIVSFTLSCLLTFVLAMLPSSAGGASTSSGSIFPIEVNSWPALLQATALMFVAYTGYGRIATLGEEVHEPRRTIPRAMIITLITSMVVYLSVAWVLVSAGSLPSELSVVGSTAKAPLEEIASSRGSEFLPVIVTLGAVTALMSVMLNLILGLSRVLLAMGRRGDMPAVFARLNPSQTTPPWAVLAVGAVIGGLVLIGDIKTTWSFSAFTVLLYYSVTNLAALGMPREERLYPRVLAYLGLVSCLFLAFWVDSKIWIAGLALLLLGLIWHAVARSHAGKSAQEK